MASELAIGIAEARYELAAHQHVAGKLDVLPDFLSRFANLVLREFPPADLKEFTGLGSTLGMHPGGGRGPLRWMST